MGEHLTAALLEEVTTQVLEEAAFLTCEVAAELGAPSGGGVEVCLSFRGPERGTLHLAGAPAFCTELAGNLLGLEVDDPELASQGPAALSELLNILGGAIVARWFGTAELCELGIPTLCEQSGARPGMEAAGIVLQSGESQVELQVRIQRD